MICKHKIPKTNIMMTPSRKVKQNNVSQANICGICLCRTCNAQFGIMAFNNHCVFHHFENKKQNIQNQIKRNKAVNNDNLQRVKNAPKSFFNSVYEKFNPRETEVSCRHCFLNKIQVEYSFFQQCSSLKSKDYKYQINNINDIRNVTQMKAKNLLKEYKCFSKNDDNTKHTLYFDENIHRPATLF